jgi:hypothetical protein
VGYGKRTSSRLGIPRRLPGGDGTYYFGSEYTQRQFNVDFATDELSET